MVAESVEINHDSTTFFLLLGDESTKYKHEDALKHYNFVWSLHPATRG
jgi:hypothetical protein